MGSERLVGEWCLIVLLGVLGGEVMDSRRLGYARYIDVYMEWQHHCKGRYTLYDEAV